MRTELSRRDLLKAAAFSMLPAAPDAQNSIEAKGNVPTPESLTRLYNTLVGPRFRAYSPLDLQSKNEYWPDQPYIADWISPRDCQFYQIDKNVVTALPYGMGSVGAETIGERQFYYINDSVNDLYEVAPLILAGSGGVARVKHEPKKTSIGERDSVFVGDFSLSCMLPQQLKPLDDHRYKMLATDFNLLADNDPYNIPRYCFASPDALKNDDYLSVGPNTVYNFDIAPETRLRTTGILKKIEDEWMLVTPFRGGADHLMTRLPSSGVEKILNFQAYKEGLPILVEGVIEKAKMDLVPCAQVDLSTSDSRYQCGEKLQVFSTRVTRTLTDTSRVEFDVDLEDGFDIKQFVENNRIERLNK